MRTVAIPIISFKYEFTAASSTPVTPTIEASDPIPFQHIPKSWALQVTGYDINGAVVAPSEWDVMLLGSLDGVVYDESSLLVAHVQGVNANGATAWPLVSIDKPVNFMALKCKTLTLGATAVKIVATVLGVY